MLIDIDASNSSTRQPVVVTLLYHHGFPSLRAMTNDVYVTQGNLTRLECKHEATLTRP